jgi:hypothetical protein
MPSGSKRLCAGKTRLTGVPCRFTVVQALRFCRFDGELPITWQRGPHKRREDLECGESSRAFPMEFARTECRAGFRLTALAGDRVYKLKSFDPQGQDSLEWSAGFFKIRYLPGPRRIQCD